MSFLKRRRSDSADTPPADLGSTELSNNDTISGPDIEHEEVLQLQRQGSSAIGVGGRLAKRRRQERTALGEQRQGQPRDVAPPLTPASQESLQTEAELPEEERDEDSESSTPSFEGLLKWNDMPYPRLPVSLDFHLCCIHFIIPVSDLMLTLYLSVSANQLRFLLRIRTHLLCASSTVCLKIARCSLAPGAKVRGLGDLLAPSLA
jgi:hypothetical protein